MTRCTECNGTGDAERIGGYDRPCDACHGEGELPPCPGCAAKDEAMEAFKAEVSEACQAVLKWGDRAMQQAKLSRFIIPPADPVAEALKAAMLEAWPAYVRDHAESDCQREAEAIAKALDKQGHTIIAKSRLPLGGAK